MTYHEAREAAKNGALIKRPHWYNPLRYRRGVLEFVKAIDMRPGQPSRTYGSPKHERAATDWVVVEVISDKEAA